ncbi:hypothetical protein [Pseudoalteromonas sp. PA2MD11]|uniref:hypothetical protein n=1 Tax=Pseudoalteromonas sp. PA2MD11 TaxID=2785057 RepID=UPI001ADEF6CE|nr:hypothetical protein [Pseudoalteromonas sp. PA2MD11]
MKQGIDVLTPERCNELVKQLGGGYITPELQSLLDVAKSVLNTKVVTTFDGELIERPLDELTALFRILSRASNVVTQQSELPIWSDTMRRNYLLFSLFREDQAKQVNEMVEQLKAEGFDVNEESDSSRMALRNGLETLTEEQTVLIKRSVIDLCSLCSHCHVYDTTSEKMPIKRCLISGNEATAKECNQFLMVTNSVKDDELL